MPVSVRSRNSRDPVAERASRRAPAFEGPRRDTGSRRSPRATGDSPSSSRRDFSVVLASASETKDGAIPAAETREPHIGGAETGAARRPREGPACARAPRGWGGGARSATSRPANGRSSGRSVARALSRAYRRAAARDARMRGVPPIRASSARDRTTAAVERQKRGSARSSDRLEPFGHRPSEGFTSACAARGSARCDSRALAVSRRVRQPNVPRADFRKGDSYPSPRSAGGPGPSGRFFARERSR